MLDGTVVPSNPAPNGPAMTSFDHFGITNSYYAPQLGLSAELSRGPWSLDVVGKIGLGLVHQTATTQGGTVLTQADGSLATYPGGVLVQPGSGPASENHFAAIPEIAITAGCRITPWLRVQAGYDLLGVSRLTRASSLVGGVDSRQVFQLSLFDASVSSAGPSLQLPGGSFSAQGLTCGLEVEY